MSLDLTDLKYAVVEPALVVIGLNSTSALNLVTGTALVESDATCLRQTGGGPALGLWQMEPATDADIWKTYLAFQTDLATKIRSKLNADSTADQLVYNLQYAAMMCRVKFRRAPTALPDPKDAAGMAAYWKANYNSVLGAGAVDASTVALFAQAIAA